MMTRNTITGIVACIGTVLLFIANVAVSYWAAKEGVTDYQDLYSNMFMFGLLEAVFIAWPCGAIYLCIMED